MIRKPARANGTPHRKTEWMECAKASTRPLCTAGGSALNFAGVKVWKLDYRRIEPGASQSARRSAVGARAGVEKLGRAKRIARIVVTADHKDASVPQESGVDAGRVHRAGWGE